MVIRTMMFIDMCNYYTVQGSTHLLLFLFLVSGGHLDVTRLLIDSKADVDSQDNRKMSCLMAAFRKVHKTDTKLTLKHSIREINYVSISSLPLSTFFLSLCCPSLVPLSHSSPSFPSSLSFPSLSLSLVHISLSFFLSFFLSFSHSSLCI